jgi:hypothetical protein
MLVRRFVFVGSALPLSRISTMGCSATIPESIPLSVNLRVVSVPERSKFKGPQIDPLSCVDKEEEGLLLAFESRLLDVGFSSVG